MNKEPVNFKKEQAKQEINRILDAWPSDRVCWIAEQFLTLEKFEQLAGEIQPQANSDSQDPDH